MPTKHFLLTLTSGMSAFQYNTLQVVWWWICIETWSLCYCGTFFLADCKTSTSRTDQNTDFTAVSLEYLGTILKDEEAVVESVWVFWSLKMAKEINIYIVGLILLWSPAIKVWWFTKAKTKALLCLFLAFCFKVHITRNFLLAYSKELSKWSRMAFILLW